MIESLFKDKNGNLNKNWKHLYLKYKDQVDAIDLPYDTKTNLLLTIKGLTALPLCPICNKELKIEQINNVYCGRKCSANDIKIIKKKISNTDLVTKNNKISKSLKGITTNSWTTRRLKYGKSGYSVEGLNSIRYNLCSSQTKETLNLKYGVDNPFKILHVKKLISQIQTTNNSSRSHLPDWLYNKECFSKVYAKEGRAGILNRSKCCLDLFNRLSYNFGLREKRESSAEIEIKTYIESLGFSCSKSRKIIPPYELDIYIPEKKLAIEFNGLYWHSSGSEAEEIISGNHLMKTEMCESIGIRLLHIFENEWVDPIKKDWWKSVIQMHLGLLKQPIIIDDCILDRRWNSLLDYPDSLTTPPRGYNFDKDHILKLSKFSNYENGYRRIWDSGTIIYKKRNPKVP